MAGNEINEALASLEVLMSEFFAPTTNNVRKREIENLLENFSSRADCWKHCLLFLQKSQNQYVLMFTLTTLENIINRQWISLSDSDKTEVRHLLWNELMTKHEVMLYFIRNKIAALMVSIARYDWPHLYDDFFSNIVELIRCEGGRCLLGLVLAQVASEELGAARDTGVLLPSARRSQLERLMLKGMPQLLAALSAILEKNTQEEGQSNPPPSPTNGVPQTSALPDLLANAHDVHAIDKTLKMEIVVKCLNTLQHLFSWLPLSSHVPPSLVTTVFYWGSIATQSQSTAAAIAGLGGVCELLYRRYAPPSSAATALRLHHCALRLLRHLAHAPHHVHAAHHDYLNKLAEFLKLFVSLHFKRLEAEPEFDAIEFLSYLFQYTFQVPTCAIFVNCLDIWIQFIDVLKPEDTAKYWEALQALVNGILNKIQFQHNKAQLQHLDNEACDDDGETEWQTFLKHCIECIARVADLAPLDIFTCVMERWQGLSDVYARAAPRGAADGERLLAALLDLATLTRLLGRLAPPLLTERERSGGGGAMGGALMERVAGALAGAALTRPHRAHAAPHAHALAHVHAEMFACMGAWCCYASECGVSIQTMEGLFSSATPFLLPHEISEPPLLCHAAAHLLLSLSKNVKFVTDPIFLVGDLYNHAQRSLQYLEPKTAGVVRESLLSLALRGAAGAGGGEAARALVAAWSGALATQGAAVALPPLTALLHAFAHAPTHHKKVLSEGMAAAAESALRALIEGAGPAAEAAVTEFFLALFTALLPQLGNFAYTAIDVFLQVAQRCGGESSAERVVECVRLGVEAGGGGVRVSAVLQLLHEHVLPRVHAAAPALAALLASAAPLPARVNALMALSDICTRYTCIVEPLLDAVSGCVCVSAPAALRRTAARALTRLLLAGYLRLRTPLYYRYCALLADEDHEVREPAEYYVTGCLTTESIYHHFVDCILYYNKNESDKISFDSRQLIYDVMLQRLSVVQKLNVQCRIAREVLQHAADVADERPGDELPAALSAALLDAITLLCGPRMKLPTKKPQNTGDADIDDLQERVTTNIVSHKMKRTVAEELVPGVLRLYGRARASGGQLAAYLVRLATDLLSDYRLEIEELIENDEELVERVRHFQETIGLEPSFGNARNLVTSSAPPEPDTPRAPRRRPRASPRGPARKRALRL